MKKHVKLLLSISLLVLIVAGTFVYAALKDSARKGPIKYQIGKLEYVVNGNIMDNYLYPGKNLVTESYTLKNNSNIETEIKIKLRFYLKDIWYEAEEFKAFTETEGFDFSGENWSLEDDGYLYYSKALVEGETITLFTKLIFDGNVVKNDFEASDFKIELILHAKQKDHVSWEDLGSKLIN